MYVFFNSGKRLHAKNFIKYTESEIQNQLQGSKSIQDDVIYFTYESSKTNLLTFQPSSEKIIATVILLLCTQPILFFLFCLFFFDFTQSKTKDFETVEQLRNVNTEVNKQGCKPLEEGYLLVQTQEIFSILWLLFETISKISNFFLCNI